MWLNTDWTSYGNIIVNTNLGFGQDYYSDFSWDLSNGASEPEPNPFTGATEPLKDFYFSSGTINIRASDLSRIILTPVAQPGESAFEVSVSDPDGNELGNFPLVLLTIKCAERLGTCLVP